MRHISTCILALMIASIASLNAQERLYSAAIFGSFTTSSKLFHHPNDADEFVRSQFFPLDNIFSAGIDLRRNIEPFHIEIGFSIEYVTKAYSSSVLSSNSITIAIEDGFTAIPIELSGYFFIPIGNEKIQFYMGGGIGTYIGYRNYAYAGANAPTVQRKVGYGIHILSGIEYAVSPIISLRSEIKFRDVQFETSNKFLTPTVTYHGSIVTLNQAPFDSRVNVDGMTIDISLVFHF